MSAAIVTPPLNATPSADAPVVIGVLKQLQLRTSSYIIDEIVHIVG